MYIVNNTNSRYASENVIIKISLKNNYVIMYYINMFVI